MKKRIRVYTIGHSTRSLNDFIELLKNYHITQLIDIRTIPQSRHNPQFNKVSLAHALRSHHIGYRHQKNMGGLRHAQPDSINTAWKNKSFRGFADYMQTASFKRGLESLIKTAHKKSVVIMCAEAVPWRCHRSLIGDALIARGIEVQDIYSIVSSKPHALTSWAQVHGTNVTYPAKQSLRRKNMAKDFKIGDYVSWNSEVGRVRGIIKKKITSEIMFKNYKVHASKEEPQYLLESLKTGHLAMHKGSALRKIKKPTKK